MQFLLDHGADINKSATGKPGEKWSWSTLWRLFVSQPNVTLSPIHLAAVAGHTEVVQLLLQRGAYPTVSHPFTALHLAAEYGHPAIIKLLVEVGHVNVDVLDGEGRTPLLCAATSGEEAYPQCMRMLKDLGANLDYVIAADADHAHKGHSLLWSLIRSLN